MVGELVSFVEGFRWGLATEYLLVGAVVGAAVRVVGGRRPWWAGAGVVVVAATLVGVQGQLEVGPALALAGLAMIGLAWDDNGTCMSSPRWWGVVGALGTGLWLGLPETEVVLGVFLMSAGAVGTVALLGGATPSVAPVLLGIPVVVWDGAADRSSALWGAVATLGALPVLVARPRAYRVGSVVPLQLAAALVGSRFIGRPAEIPARPVWAVAVVAGACAAVMVAGRSPREAPVGEQSRTQRPLP